MASSKYRKSFSGRSRSAKPSGSESSIEDQPVTATRNFGAGRGGRTASGRAKAMTQLEPPKAKALERTIFGSAFRAFSGT